jgi:hypothetical protein
MKRPSAVDRLMDELEGEMIDSDVEIVKTSKMVICLNQEDKVGFELTASECKLVLADADTAQRLIEALEHTSAASVLLCDLWPDDEVMEVLEQNFNAVDEG